MSSDLISRQAVLAIVKDSYLDLGKFEDSRVFCAEIKALPSVENNGKQMSNSIRIKLIDGYNGEELGHLFSTVVPREGEVIHLQNMPKYNFHVRRVEYLTGVDEYGFVDTITHVEVFVTV